MTKRKQNPEISVNVETGAGHVDAFGIDRQFSVSTAKETDVANHLLMKLCVFLTFPCPELVMVCGDGTTISDSPDLLHLALKKIDYLQ